MREFGLILMIVSAVILMVMFSVCIGEYWNYTAGFLFLFSSSLVTGFAMYKLGTKTKGKEDK